MDPLRTPRLTLIPLSPEQMELLVSGYSGLEPSLGLRPSGLRLDAELRAIARRSIAFMAEAPESAIWHTCWIAVLEADGEIAGNMGFKGPPGEAGEVEIGYGFLEGRRNRGLATEAVIRMVDWALSQPGVEAVIAETENRNVPSMRVLQKAGFVLTRATAHFLYWRCGKGERGAAGPGSSRDGTFDLFDLTVVVEQIEGTCTCDMRVGDRFFLRNSSSLSLPEGRHFCVYALQSVLPLLPAKQRLNHLADWMETDSRVVCPDPACGLVMRIDRSARRTLHHDDVSPIPWDSVS